MQYAYLKFSDATAYNQSKKAVSSALDYIKTVYRGFRKFMELTQPCVFNQHFDDT